MDFTMSVCSSSCNSGSFAFSFYLLASLRQDGIAGNRYKRKTSEIEAEKTNVQPFFVQYTLGWSVEIFFDRTEQVN